MRSSVTVSSALHDGHETLSRFVKPLPGVIVIPPTMIFVTPKIRSEDPAVFQEVVYGVPRSSAPRFAPSSLNCTPATPTLSLALAVIDTTPDTVALFAGAVIDTVGGVVSGAESV